MPHTRTIIKESPILQIITENGKQGSKYYDAWRAAGQSAVEKSMKKTCKTRWKKCTCNKWVQIRSKHGEIIFSTCSIQMISVAIEPVTSTPKNSASNELLYDNFVNNYHILCHYGCFSLANVIPV